jgi:hypothetical protein
MSSLAKEQSTDYVPDFGGNQIMLEIYQAKMAELNSVGTDQFRQNIKSKLVIVVQQIVTEMYENIHVLLPSEQAQAVTKDFQLFSWFASEWETLGEPTGESTGKLRKQPHFFVKALVNPDTGLFKYGDKCYFHRKEGEEWKLNTYIIHEWEEREKGYSAAVGAMKSNLTTIWTNRKALCLYSREYRFTPFQRGKLIDFDYGYAADKHGHIPAYRYVKPEEKGTYTNIFGYRLEDFQVEFQDMLNRNPQWHNMDMVELKNILIETLILFHELIHVVTNTAHQVEKQDTESEMWPAMPRDYPVEEFTVEDWPDFTQADEYKKAIDKEDKKQFEEKGETVWPFFSDGSGHGVEFCNMYSLFAGMRGQTTLCSVSYEKRKTRRALQKKLPGGIARPKVRKQPVGPKLHSPKSNSTKYVPQQEEDGTTRWVKKPTTLAKQLYIKLRF